MKKPSMSLLMKRSSENLPSSIDDVVAQMIYGNLRKPPGDENSPYQKLLMKKNDVEIPGVWTPANSYCKAMALKWFFPNISNPFKLPEQKPLSPHLIVGYDAFKYKEVMELSKQYPEAVMKYGFFNTDIPGEAQLLTKTVDKFEKRTSLPTYEEKIVIQLAKCEESFFEFYDLGPSYISPDTVKGAEDAKLFFPPTYDIPEDVILEIKKKPKKKIKNKLLAVVGGAQGEQIPKTDTTEVTTTENETTTNEQISDDRKSIDEKGEDEELEEIDIGGDDEEGDEEVDETDKATSPMAEEISSPKD